MALGAAPHARFMNAELGFAEQTCRSELGFAEQTCAETSSIGGAVLTSVKVIAEAAHPPGLPHDAPQVVALGGGCRSRGYHHRAHVPGPGDRSRYSCGLYQRTPHRPGDASTRTGPASAIVCPGVARADLRTVVRRSVPSRRRNVGARLPGG